MSDNYKKLANQRQAREKRTRLHMKDKSSRLRLAVFRTPNHIYAQIIDDEKHQTLLSSSTLLKEFKSLEERPKGINAAKWVGKDIAMKAVASGVTQVAFDRGRFLYHGRVKALAEAARENGLVF